MSKPQHPHTKAQLVKATRAKSALAKVVSNENNRNNDNSTAKPYPQTDPAVLIGLAMAFGRQLGSAAVPAIILNPLTAAAQAGCGASQMVVGFLNRRASRVNETAKHLAVGAGQGLHLIPADRKDGAVYDGGKAHV